MYAIDADGDGDNDFFAAAMDADLLALYVNEGYGKNAYVDFTRIDIAAGSEAVPSDVMPTDVDGDGDIDCVIAADSGDRRPRRASRDPRSQ